MLPAGLFHLAALLVCLYCFVQPVYAAEKKKKVPVDVVYVTVDGVKGELRRNVYNHLAIYQLRNNPRLQRISVNQLFRQAKDDIARALAPYGYYNPGVESKLKEAVDNGKHRWQAFFTIDLGKPVLVAKAEVNLLGRGQRNKRLARQVKAFALKEGALLNQKIYEQEKKKLIRTALEEGYLNASFIRSEVRIDPAENKGWIWLNLDTGERFHFGETIMVSDSDRSLDHDLLRGYLPWKQSDPYNVAKLFKLQSILHGTGFFSAVDVRGKRQQAADGFIPVEAVVRFSEKNNKYTVGFGYATDAGARVKLKWKNRMLSSGGDKVGVALEIAEREKNISLSYERPREENPLYDRYLFTSSYQEKSWDDTSSRPFIIAAGRNYSSPTFSLGASLEFRDEVYTSGGVRERSDLFIPSANIGFVLADDITAIKNGLRLAAEVRGAAEELFSDADFFQWTISGKAVLSPFSRWIFSDRVTWGMMLGDGINSIPPSLRFYAGGDNSIRGFSYNSIAPEDSEGRIIGGRYLLVQSVEAERLIGEYFGIAAFWDVGNATDDLSLDFEQGVGLGLRVHMPFGEIKLDIASAVSRSNHPFRLHFSVGGTL